RLRHGDRDLAAREEARFLAAFGDEVRLGEALEQTARLQRLDDRAQIVLEIPDEEVQEVAEDQLLPAALAVQGRHGILSCRDPADDVVELAVRAGEETHAELGQRAAR